VEHVVTVDPFDLEECTRVLKEETEREAVSVIITNRPCIFADKSAIKVPYEIDKDLCSGCKMCLRLGCPAIFWNEGAKQAGIDAAQCTGCSLCVKVCKFGAISQMMV
jgi:indolepyruvate ferredoxin oxidoreductase alpha subunit